jgi:hypothetical protein
MFYACITHNRHICAPLGYIPSAEVAQWQAKLPELRKQYPNILFFAQPMEKKSVEFSEKQ